MLNKKLIILSVLLVSLIAAGVTLLKAPKKVTASEYPIPAREEPQLHTDSLTTNDPSSQKKASQVAEELVGKWREKVEKSEGWLHLVYQINSEIDNGVILPDGRTMPSSYTEDAWYFLNKQGLVEKSVVTLKDETGNILQQTVFTGDTETNLTFGDKMENLTPFELRLDRGILQYLIDAETLKISVKNQDVKYKDKPNKEFSFTEAYEQPVQFNEKDPVKGASVSALFSNESGELTLYRKIWKYNNGEEALFEECELLLTELASDVPSDILESVS